MHQAAIKSLGLIKDDLRQKSVEKEATHHEQIGKRRQKSQSPRNRDQIHLAEEITRHKRKTHETSSHKPG
jgi:hypothetical protein